MSKNPFAGFDIDIPKKYQEEIKRFCQTGGSSGSYTIRPFERQVDFWYLAFVYAVNKGLTPKAESETYHPIQGHILSDERVTHILLVYFSSKKMDISVLSEYRQAFNFAINMANAGIPHLLQILNDPEGDPLWNLLDALESQCS